MFFLIHFILYISITITSNDSDRRSASVYVSVAESRRMDDSKAGSIGWALKLTPDLLQTILIWYTIFCGIQVRDSLEDRLSCVSDILFVILSTGSVKNM